MSLLVAEADALLASRNPFNKGRRLENAVELLQKGAAQYKLDKEWKLAAETYERAATVAQQKANDGDNDDDDEHVQFWKEAAQCYSRCGGAPSVASAVRLFRLVANHLAHAHHGQLAGAAAAWRDAAKLQETCGLLDQAREAFSEAARCYEAAHSLAAARECSISVARLLAGQGKFQEAYEVYDKCGTEASEQDLSSWSARDHFFWAALCLWVATGDDQACKARVDEYADLLPKFTLAREYKLLQQLLDAASRDSIDDFANAVRKHDETTKIDPFTTKLLLEIRRHVENGDAVNGTVADSGVGGRAAQGTKDPKQQAGQDAERALFDPVAGLV